MRKLHQSGRSELRGSGFATPLRGKSPDLPKLLDFFGDL